MLVSRPIFPLGRDVGYLPGDLEQKLNPWMQPIYDNVEFLMGLSKAETKADAKNGRNGRGGRSYHELIDLGFIEIEPLTYIRGRSIPNLTTIVEKFKAEGIAGHVTLSKGERSVLAELASNLL